MRAALDDLATRIEARERASGPARLHVDRSFSLRGIGTVVTGTLWSGELEPGQEVRIEPSGRIARIRSVQVHDHPVERAGAGQRVALNLAATERDQVERGDLVTALPERNAAGPAAAPTFLIDGIVRLDAGAPPLRRGMRVHVHHGTREAPGRITPLEGEALRPGTAAFAQLRLEHPLMPAAGDRFVIRQIAPPDTIGGGTVVDPRPRRHGPGPEHVRRLAALSSGDPLERLAVALAEARSGLAITDGEQPLLEQLRGAGRAAPAGLGSVRWFSPERLEEASGRIIAALAQAGGRPASRGALARAAGLDDDAAAAVLETLVAEARARPLGPGYVAAGPAAAPEDPLGVRLLEALEADGLEPRARTFSPSRSKRPLRRCAQRSSAWRSRAAPCA